MTCRTTTSASPWAAQFASLWVCWICQSHNLFNTTLISTSTCPYLLQFWSSTLSALTIYNESPSKITLWSLRSQLNSTTLKVACASATTGFKNVLGCFIFHLTKNTLGISNNTSILYICFGRKNIFTSPPIWTSSPDWVRSCSTLSFKNYSFLSMWILPLSAFLFFLVPCEKKFRQRIHQLWYRSKSSHLYVRIS